MQKIIVVLSLFYSFVLSPPEEKEKWLVERSSRIIIEGSSNINDFICEIGSRKRTDTLTINYDEEDGEIIFIKNKVFIDVNSFDCGNHFITSDFKKTLKADKYEKIILYFLTLQRPKFSDFTSHSVMGKIKINIAGTSNTYSIKYKIIPNTDGTIKLEGSKKFNIREFNLSPPQKLMGLIKVKEEIEVAFNMLLKPIL